MFDAIRPYNDEEAVAALKRVAISSVVEPISHFLFPGEDVQKFRDLLSSLDGVEDFQERVMAKAIESIVNQTTDGLTCTGLDNFYRENGEVRHSLLLSNHRDIVLDSAFIQLLLFWHKLPFSEIAVGDNLMVNPVVEDMIRSNRMIKVVRSENPREVYTTSKVLSEYIRGKIGKGEASIWLAHRNGRTKDGCDHTEQGLLKMLDMSGKGGFADNFEEISVMPVAVSYEYESCDLLKALELFHKRRDGHYKKQKNEDLNSMITGITMPKGRVHIEFCKHITREELEEAQQFDKNERFRRVAEIVDERIVSAFKLWPNNYIAASIVTGSRIGDFTVEEKGRFEAYLERLTASVPAEIDKNEIRKILLEIYSAPLLRKLK